MGGPMGGLGLLGYPGSVMSRQLVLAAAIGVVVVAGCSTSPSASPAAPTSTRSAYPSPPGGQQTTTPMPEDTSPSDAAPLRKPWTQLLGQPGGKVLVPPGRLILTSVGRGSTALEPRLPDHPVYLTIEMRCVGPDNSALVNARPVFENSSHEPFSTGGCSPIATYGDGFTATRAEYGRIFLRLPPSATYQVGVWLAPHEAPSRIVQKSSHA